VKPDLVAAGETVITADTTVYESFGAYPPYMVLDGFGGSGTSFSAPFVTGSIAVLMSARPGLTAAQLPVAGNEQCGGAESRGRLP